MMTLLSLKGVGKRFRGLVAVDDVSFDVQAGELFAVIGPNGAGKPGTCCGASTCSISATASLRR